MLQKILATKDFSQNCDIDYLATFASIAKINTVCVILALIAIKEWKLLQLDVKNMFINGDLEEKIYISKPLGYKDTVKCCKLQKASHGLT